MDAFLDELIDYENPYDPKLDSLLEQNFTMSSPFSYNSDSTDQFPTHAPQNLQNLLFGTDNTNLKRETHRGQNNTSINKQKPFQIIRDSQRGQQSESPESDGTETKLNGKSKRIKGKRDKPRPRMNAETLLHVADSKYIPGELYDPNLDGETRKKMIQVVRNRVSAQNSRDKRKNYLVQLEETNEALSEENARVNREKNVLIEKVQTLETEKAQILQELENIRNNGEILCSKCKCAMENEYSAQSGGQGSTAEYVSFGLSNMSSPVLSRFSSTGGKLFGFSFVFVALACVIFFVNGGDFTDLGMRLHAMRIQSEDIIEETTDMDWSNIDDDIQPLVGSPYGGNFYLNNFKFGDFPIMNQIPSLMELFQSLHGYLYDSYENNEKTVIDLATTPLSDLKAENSNMFRNSSFLGKNESNMTAGENKTSTLFCPSGFEFFKHDKKARFEEEVQLTNTDMSIDFMGPEFSNSQGVFVPPRTKTLDLEKADYIQLLVPKYSVGRMGVTENTSEIETLPIQHLPEEDNTLVEIWCKIYAVRDIH